MILFVYGTLRAPDAATLPPNVCRAVKSARCLGPATTRGRLLDCGDYPAFADGDGTVHGDLLDVPPITLATFDRWEDVAGGLYDRVRRTAIHDGRGIDVQLYRYLGPTDRLPVVPGGDWRKV